MVRCSIDLIAETYDEHVIELSTFREAIVKNRGSPIDAKLSMTMR